MGQKLSFNDLPSAVEKILKVLTSEGSEHAELQELVQRMTRLEKKIEYLLITTSPDKPVMDMQSVCRILKLKPKAVYELANSGILPSREQGRKTVFYEEGVIKYFASQPAWKAASVKSKPEPAAPLSNKTAQIDIPVGERQRVEVFGASQILDRSTAAVYQLALNGRVPHHKEGKKIYFFSDELREWAKDNPPRKRKHKNETM